MIHKKLMPIFMFLISSLSYASVCGGNFQTYNNSSAAIAAGQLIIFNDTCAAYQSYENSWYVYNNNYSTSQYNTSNRSYMERFVSSSFSRLVGNDEMGQYFLAILVGAGFFAFVSFQNTRIEGKAVVLIPAAALMGFFVGWLLLIAALIVGVIIYLGLIRLFSK